MRKIQLIIFVEISTQITLLLALNCQEEMNYHKKYSYGYDIFCSNLNPDNSDELGNITVYNEVKLTIEKSNLTNLQFHLFKNIPKTRELIIRSCTFNFTKNSSPFEKLNKLELLDLNNNVINNNISKGFFKGLDHLKVLNLSANNLVGLDAEALNNIPKIEEIDLSRNNLHYLTLCDLQKLRYLYANENNLKSLNNSSITCLKQLKHLELNHNKIQELLPLSHLRYLVRLSLTNNLIEDVANFLQKLEQLEELNLEGNKIKMINARSFQGNSMLKKLNLKNNHISEIYFENLTALEELILENNKLTEVPNLDIRSLRKMVLSNNSLIIKDQAFKNLNNLVYLGLSHCNLDTVRKENLGYLNWLKTLDLSFNNIKLTSTSFYGLENLAHLNLRGNLLYKLQNSTFQFVPNLEILDISNNKLKQIPNSIFANLKNLEILNLSYNHLESVSENVLVPLVNLKTLDLEGNRLKLIDYDSIISVLPTMKLINVRENQLTCEFLTKMLNYFRDKRINYSVGKKDHYNKENVAGIPCLENNDIIETNRFLSNDSEILDKIYHLTNGGDKSLLIVSLLVLGIFIFIVSVFIIRMYVVLKRRIYVSDDIELLDVRLDKRSNYT